MAARVTGHAIHHSNAARMSIMSPYDQERFWQLGRDARTGGTLPPAYRHAREVASTIHDDLAEVGLSNTAIRRVACALLDVCVSGGSKRVCGAPPARQPRGENTR